MSHQLSKPWRRVGAVVVAASVYATSARADEPQPEPTQNAPRKLWTKLETSASRKALASLACSLDAKSLLEARMRHVDIQVPGICSSPSHDDALHAVVTVSTDASAPVIVEIEVPEGLSPSAVDELKGVLRDVTGELRRRANALPPESHAPIRGVFFTRVSASQGRREVCFLNATTRIDARTRPIVLNVEKDGAFIACSKNAPDAVRVYIQFPAGQMIVDIDQTGETAAAVEDLRKLLPELGTVLQGRAGARWRTREGRDAVVELGPHPPVQPPPTETAPKVTTDTSSTPRRTVTSANWEVIGVGLGLTLGGYAASALMGLAVSNPTAQQSPSGNWPYWPYVPFIGAFAFAVTYKDSADLNGSAAAFSRLIAVATGVIIDAVQLVGAGVIIAGVAIPKVRVVGDTSLRLVGNGVALEGRF